MRGKFALAAALALSLAFAAAGCGAQNESGKAPEPELPPVPGEETDEKYPDIPDIPPDEEVIVPDYTRPFDDSVKYTYTDSYRSAALARFYTSEAEGESSMRYTSAEGGMFAVNQTAPFPYGTFSATVKTVAGADSGVVFCLKAPESASFWESDPGLGYYFFFINAGGNAHLAQVGPLGRNTSWSDLRVEPLAGFDPNGTYRLKVVLKSNKICCYVNGELTIAYRAADLLPGTGFGLRTQGTGVEFSDISLTNDYLY